MTPPTPQTQRELIDYKFNEVFKRLDRIEGKMDGFTYVKESDFVEFRQQVKDNYVTKDDFSPIKKFYYGLLGSFLLGIVAFGFFLLERTIK